MSNILVINHSVENCGVYQYGKRVADILKKSNKYNFVYLEIDSQDQLVDNINKYQPKIIIYNHLSGTMPWATREFIHSIKDNFKIKQGTIVHNIGYSGFFDFYLHQDPNFIVEENNFNLLRPLFSNYESKKHKDDGITRIGSFGFGFRSKFYPHICRLVNQQSNSFENIEINLHLTQPFFCESALDEIAYHCNSEVTSPNVKLNVTSHFLSTDDLLDFLSRNSLNIFFYQDYSPNYNGISSVIDYALSVRKPIAICKSNMFSHIWNSSPSICVEDSSLKDIIENGTTPLHGYYEKWSNLNFIQHVENIMDLLKN